MSQLGGLRPGRELMFVKAGAAVPGPGDAQAALLSGALFSIPSGEVLAKVEFISPPESRKGVLAATWRLEIGKSLMD